MYIIIISSSSSSSSIIIIIIIRHRVRSILVFARLPSDWHQVVTVEAPSPLNTYLLHGAESFLRS